MRRITWLVIPFSLALGACEGTAFSAHSDTVAEAAGQQLSAERVAEFITSVKGATPTDQMVDAVAGLWVDYTLFAQAVADNSLGSDSAFVSAAMWPEVAQFTAGHWMDSLLAVRGKVTPEVIDSAYKAGGVRVLQHVLVQVDPSATDAKRSQAERKIERILQRAERGTDFGTLALENSDDIATKVDSGFLPPSPRGSFVPAFDSVAWGLAPGQMSGVVPTSYGFHIIKRATEAQAKTRLIPVLQQQLAAVVDSAYKAELDSIYDIELASGAAARAREALSDLSDARSNNDALAKYKGGELTVAQFALWVQANIQNPVQAQQQLAQMQQLPDSVIERGIKVTANLSLFLKAATDAGMELTPDQWQEVKTEFKGGVDSLKATIGLGPEVLDSTASKADRERAAALRVDQFFDQIASGQKRPRLLPGMLAWTLREDAKAKINPAGIKRAVELAQAKITADSTAAVAAGSTGAAGMGNAPKVVEPAPGGPPVPNGN